MQLEHVVCDLCGSASYRIRYRKPDTWLKLNLFEYPVVECTDCGLVFVNPRPTPESMAAFYPQGYHDGRNGEEFLARYATQRSLLPSLVGKRVLDIGCARGDFLSFLLQNEAFEAHGIDAFSTKVHDSRISFLHQRFDQSNYPTDYFDIVMSWAVFEHLHWPSLYFEEASRVLVSGGKLIVLVTNSESLYGRIAQIEDVPRHTYHYSENTLRSYAEKSGLRLTSVAFNDGIFDGRGRGTLRMLAGRLLGFSWNKVMTNRLSIATKIAMKFGGALDAIVFATHWENRLRSSGIMVATYEKP